jgi:two-component system C4-dicarboxylate transport sensor histidine kinase DctB
MSLAGVHYILFEKLVVDLRASEISTLELVTASLRSEIRQFEILGSVLADNKELLNFLISETPERQLAINRQLEQINQTTGALDTYLMNLDGVTIAASNWKKQDSFVGRNFSYRPYFQLPILGQAGNFFAIGTSTNLRGFYIGTPVILNHKPIGAVIIKMRVEHLERQWKAENREISLLDENEIVFVSTNPDWRLTSFRPLSPQQRSDIEKTRRYPDVNKIKILHPEQVSTLNNGDKIISIEQGADESKQQYLTIEANMAEAQWTVLLSRRIDTVAREAFIGTVAIGFGLSGLGIITAAIYRRFKLNRRRLETEQRNRNKLEEAIANRTKDLQLANEELLDTQQKLVQSGRLAAIGRFSAGLSHEISQPLTAIHSYVSNAQQLITLNRTDEAEEKLERIASLADRITLIIRQLKIFMRGDEIITAPVSLKNTINEAQLIMFDRAHKLGASIHASYPPDDVHINADETLLLQLFVNLISNALDAVSKTDNPALEIVVSKKNKLATIKISDNGLGVSEKDLPNIFEPFYSTKQMNRGLGLGLTISQEIVNRFHGEMSVHNNTHGGATFSVTAPLATKRSA